MPRRPDQADAYIGGRIAARRAALGLTQGALAQRLGLSFQQVQKYESGLNRVPASRLNRIAGLLAAPVDHFLPPLFSGSDAASVPDEDALAMAAALPSIRDRDVRRALVCVAQALARA